MLEVQRFLRNGGTVQDLLDKYGIQSHRHVSYPNLVLLKYNQINSPMGERICQECRGLILDESNNWDVVCCPFFKFFNHGDGHAAPIDWGSARVYDKLDGSIMSLYTYDGVLRVASSGMADAQGQVNTLLGETSFAGLFWQTWLDLGYECPKEHFLTFMFEMMTPYNRIVCRYEKPRLVLLGVRNNVTLEEYRPETWAEQYGWECVKYYDMNNIEDVVEMAKTLNPMEREGFVVCDNVRGGGSFGRVKVKNPTYVALHHLKSGLSVKRLLEIVVAREDEEFLTYFPEFKTEFEQTKSKYLGLIEEIDRTYQEYKDIPGQKEFAEAVLKFPYSGVLFQMRKAKHSSSQDFVKDMVVDKLMKLLDL